MTSLNKNPAEGKFVSLQDAQMAANGDREQSLQLLSLNPLAMRNAELPGQNLERMRHLGVNGNGGGGVGMDHSDVECDDEFYDQKRFSRPTPAARDAIQWSREI